MSKNPDYEVKIIVIGDISVGKTSIINSYAKDEFLESPTPTVGLNLTSKILKMFQKSVKLQIWDTAGQEEYMSLTKSYYRSTAAVLIIFDIGNRKSFENLDIWLKEVNRNTHENIVICIVGCKEDIQNSERKISKKEAEDFCEKLGLVYYECSAKTGFGVKKIFEDAVKYVLIKIESGDIEANYEGFQGVRKLKNGEISRLEITKLRKGNIVDCSSGCKMDDKCGCF